jgi:hypothetical protein
LSVPLLGARTTQSLIHTGDAVRSSHNPDPVPTAYYFNSMPEVEIAYKEVHATPVGRISFQKGVFVMAGTAGSRNGKYLYAILADSQDRNFGEIGIDDTAVCSFSNGQVAAVVSDLANKKIRPERRHLAAHQRVIKHLMKYYTPLPIAFGIIAGSHKEIKKILSDYEDTFVEQLDRVANTVEMGLRVTWDVPNIFEYFVATHQELRSARDQLLGTYHEPSQEAKIVVGRMFERILTEERDLHCERVEEILMPHCQEIKRNLPKNENVVMNLACLVERDEQEQFEAAIFEAARLFDNNFSFDYNGPWAPHNFVDINLSI